MHMALWKFSNLNKYGNIRSRIIYKPDGEAFGFNPKGFGSFVNVQMFKYEYKHEIIPPSLFIDQEGQKYIVPTWQKVDSNTTLKDIEWVKPKPKKQRAKTVIETHISGSGLGEYTTKYYPESGKYHCSCPGYWRSKGNCKHVKGMKLNKNL
jgi:hypothetical protein